MTIKTSVEMSVMVLKVRFVGKSVRMDVIVEGAVTSARTLKIRRNTFILSLYYLNSLTLSGIIMKRREIFNIPLDPFN